jgi:uncharacterized protein
MKDLTRDASRPPAAVPAALWMRLEAEAATRARGAEPAHDFFHVERVVGNALAVARGEDASDDVRAAAATAALLHELFTLPKNHPDSARAGDRCAEKARELLDIEGAPTWLIEPVCAAIRDHSFSKGVVPDALPSRILQDADRLDALGAIGLARMWATCADMKRPFYAPEDPFCATRAPDDKLSSRSCSSSRSVSTRRPRARWPSSAWHSCVRTSRSSLARSSAEPSETAMGTPVMPRLVRL